MIPETEVPTGAEREGFIPRALSAARWNSAYSVVERAGVLASVFVMSRFVGPTPVGEFALALALSALIGQLFETGAAYGLIHRRHITPATTWAHSQVQVASTILRLGMGIALLGPVAAVFGQGVAELLLGLSLIQIIWALGVTPRVLMERRLDFKRIAAVDGVALLLSTVAGIWAAAGGWGRTALLLGGNEPALVLYTAQALGNIVVGPRQAPTAFVAPRELRWFAGFSRGIWVGAQFVPVTLHWDRLVIGFFFGPAATGLYDVAGRVAYLPMRLVQTLIARIMLPFYARIQHDTHRMARLLLTQLQLVGSVTTIFFAAFFVADSFGLPTLILGDQWAAVGSLVLGLSVSGWLRATKFTIWPALIATGQTWALARYDMVLAVLIFILAPALALANGIGGVLIAVTAGGAVVTVLLLRAMRPQLTTDVRAVAALLLPVALLGIGVASTFAFPRAGAWVAWTAVLTAAVVLVARQRAAIARLLGIARRTA